MGIWSVGRALDVMGELWKGGVVHLVHIYMATVKLMYK